MEKVVVDEDVMGGQPRVEGTRVRVVDIVGFYEVRELSPQDIAGKLGLELEDVYAALVYYYENPKSIRRNLDREAVA
jgi:uncharacterized protein (DUF433 family)